MGSGLHDTHLFASRKVKLRRHFASMSAMVSFDDTWLFRYRNSKRKIFVLRYYAPYYVLHGA